MRFLETASAFIAHVCGYRKTKKPLVEVSLPLWIIVICHSLEVFRNEFLAVCQPASLDKGPKCRSDSYWIHEFRNSGSLQTIFVELILISEITNSEIRITSTLRYFARLAGWQAARISFWKISIESGIALICRWVIVTSENYCLLEASIKFKGMLPLEIYITISRFKRKLLF